MIRRLDTLVGVAVLTAVAMVLGGCSGAGKAGGKPVVRVGFAPNVTHVVPLVGFSREKHAYETALPSVSLDAKSFNAGPAMIEALRAGALDMAFLGPGPAISAFWRGKDIVILTNTVDGGTALVARAGTNIKSVKDLAGKKVAVPQIGNTQDVLLRYQLALNGLRTAENGGPVTVQPIENAEILSLFQRGQLDAACVPEPWATRLEREAGATVVLGSADIFDEGHYLTTVLVARKDYAEKNRELVKQFVGATDRLTDEISKDPGASAPILADEIKRWTGKGVAEDDIRRSLRRCRLTSKVTQHDVHVFANLVEVAGYKTDPTASLDGILWR